MKKFGFLLVFAASLAFAQQSAAPVQLTPLPPKPTCTIILRNGACADLWRNYNQALGQRLGEQIKIYVNRQAELASTQAVAPLQQHIADLTKLTTDEQTQIKSLEEQMQAESAAALQEKSAAHREGFEYGSGIGAGVTLVLFGLIFGIRRLAQNFTVTKKPQANAASA
jgi:multidrug efflux pump subunit AcrA (membrane-fusion protein)